MLSKAEISELLGRTPLFSVLDEGLREGAAGAMTQLTVAKGETVIRQNDPGGSMFVLASGTARMFRQSEGDAVVELRRTRAPSLLGELAVLDQGPRSASVEAVTKLQLLEVNRELLMDLLDRSSGFRNALITHLTSMIRETTGRETDRALLDLKTRVAKRLIELNKDGLVGRDKVTQTQLAQMVGATRQRVNLVLQGFVAENLIRIHPLGIDVIDAERLRCHSEG